MKRERKPTSPLREEINGRLFQMEQSLTKKTGLPGRPWFIHQIYAPGQYTGYGVKTLPAIREAIEMRRWNEAREQIAVATELLDVYAKQIGNLTQVLQFALTH
jgi:N-acetylated-alpha-linked acidic dipeptidase